MEPGRKAWFALKREFGDNILYENGVLNREKLGDLIFTNVTNRKKLNEITHPEIYKEMLWNTIKYFLKGE